MCRAAMVLAAAVAGTVLVAAQQKPVFRGGVMLVSVDAYPTRDGHLVPDLAASDFEILEDGIPQKIEAFEFIRIATSPADAERRDPNTAAEGERLAADPHHRVFVAYFDTYHLNIEGARNMRPPVKEFFQRIIGPTDYVAVATPDTPIRALTFGQRLETLERAIEDFWLRAVDIYSPGAAFPQSPHEKWLESCYIDRTDKVLANEELVKRLFALWRQDLLLGSLNELTIRLASIREARSNVLLFSGGWALEGPALSLTKYAWGTIPETTVRGGRITIGNRKADGRDLSKCDAELFRLTSIDFRQRFTELIDATRRANVSFTTIDPGALSAYDVDLSAVQPPRKLTTARPALDALRTLAANTNGIAVVATNDLRTPLRRLADDASAYYLLGYYTTNAKLDGKYRKIDVRVKTPGIKVTARKGYFGPTEDTRRTTETSAGPVSGREPSATDAALARLARLHAADALFVEAAAGRGEIAVVAELASAEMAGWKNGADVRVVLTGAGGTTTPGEGRIDAGFQSALIRIKTGAETGPWTAKVAVTSGGASLSRSVDINRTAGRVLGDPILFRAAPAARSPLRPAAEPLFRRAERIHVELPVLQPVDRHVARLLDRKGQPLPVSVATSEQGSENRTLAADLNLASLAPGDYLIEVVAHSGVNVDRHLVAIRVGR